MYSLLSEAGYLITDTSFPMRYIKKRGQRILNTWHGTPLKAMGADAADKGIEIGNIQRNLLMSDYLLFPNEYTKNKMLNAYCIDGLYKGRLLMEGYPRNSVLTDSIKASKLKKSLGFEGKKVYVYMPTWRGKACEADDIAKDLSKLDRKLGDNELLLIKLHPLSASNLDLSKYKHIKKFCFTVSPYSVLAFADVLITDYSSVMFDFAVTKRKTVLFCKDENEYKNERGLYMPLSELPFPKVSDCDTLLKELRSPKNYDDTAFIDRFCPYERKDSAKRIIAQFIGEKNICRVERCCDRSKENVLIYGGTLDANGITASLTRMLGEIDTSKRRYILTFRTPDVAGHPEKLAAIPDSVRIMPMCTKLQYTAFEALAIGLYYKLGYLPAQRIIEQLCRREAFRFFGSIDVSKTVQFEGYGKNMIHLFRMFPRPRSIFVHSDMQRELRGKKIQHRMSLEKAYKSYDNVVCVSEDIIPPTKTIAWGDERIKVVHNCIGAENIVERGNCEIIFDESTASNISCDKLKELLAGNMTKLITVGRFSYEKGHDLLIRAFERFAQTHPDTLLIIIGGYGDLYEETLKRAESSDFADRIVIIRQMSNPMPVVKACDLFILSSRYEALGISALEAAALGVPVISTDIPGPRGFLQANGGWLVPLSAEGILSGIEAFSEGKIKPMNADLISYDKNAAREFEELISENQ